MTRAKKVMEATTDPLDAMLARLQLSGIRDQLDSLLDEAARANLSARETLILLCEREIARKDHRRIEMALKLAHFPAVKELAGFDFEAQPSIDPKQIRDLAASRWIANGENVLLLGPPGVGKTHLSIALGREAILAGYTVQFTTATTLVAGLAKAHGERRLDEKLLALSKPKLLIVDELGYLPLEPDAAHLFFQLVSRCYETGAMLITSNRSVAEWGTVFADPVVATAILDRLLHHSHVLTIRGDSYRLRAKRKSGLIKTPTAGDGPPVGSASLRPVTGGNNLQPRSQSRWWGQFFMTQRGQFRMAFDTNEMDELGSTSNSWLQYAYSQFLRRQSTILGNRGQSLVQIAEGLLIKFGKNRGVESLSFDGQIRDFFPRLRSQRHLKEPCVIERGHTGQKLHLFEFLRLIGDEGGMDSQFISDRCS